MTRLKGLCARKDLCGRCACQIPEPKKHMYLIYGCVWIFCSPECYTAFIKDLCR